VENAKNRIIDVIEIFLELRLGNSGLIDLVRDWGGKRKPILGCSKGAAPNVAMANCIP
jgi:hypothetical protein